MISRMSPRGGDYVNEFDERFKRCLICAKVMEVVRVLEQDDGQKPVKTVFRPQVCNDHMNDEVECVPVPFSPEVFE